MTFTEAAAEVLRQVGRPLHYKEITAYAIEKSLLSHVGKSPEVTMGARLAALFKKQAGENPLVRVRPGVFALRTWEESGQLKEMVVKTKPTARTVTAPDKPIEQEPKPEKVEKTKAKAKKKEEEVVEPLPAPTRRRPVRRKSRTVETKKDEAVAKAAGKSDTEDDVSSKDDASREVTSEKGGKVASGSVKGTSVSDAASAAAPQPPEVEASVEQARAPSVPDAPAPGPAVSDRATSDRAASAPAASAPAASAPAASAPAASDRAASDRAASAPAASAPAASAPAASATPSAEGAAREPSTSSGSEAAERAELAAGASAVFEEEEDDDQPILAPQEQSSERESSRRRRRRRRRPKSSQDTNGAAYSASPVGPTDSTHAEGAVAESRSLAATSGGQHAVVLEVGSSTLENMSIDDFGGKDMADAIALVLGAADRASGPVSLRQLAETAQRRGRLSGDLQQLQSQIAAAVRADNLRRGAAGQRPRFRFVGGRVALTDWLLNNDLARLEHEATAAVERYREAARKAFVRKLQELPGHAFIELVLLVLERLGFHHVRVMRRAGIPGQEAHFTAMHDTGAGQVHCALVIRRDGREIGRERVTELRGAFHHYGPATVGWIVTSGPVLSGAREEAAAANAPAVVLYDGFGIARLCEQHDIAVLRATMPVCIPDLDVLEALRSS